MATLASVCVVLCMLIGLGMCVEYDTSMATVQFMFHVEGDCSAAISQVPTDHCSWCQVYNYCNASPPSFTLSGCVINDTKWNNNLFTVTVGDIGNVCSGDLCVAPLFSAALSYDTSADCHNARKTISALCQMPSSEDDCNSAIPYINIDPYIGYGCRYSCAVSGLGAGPSKMSFNRGACWGGFPC